MDVGVFVGVANTENTDADVGAIPLFVEELSATVESCEFSGRPKTGVRGFSGSFAPSPVFKRSLNELLVPVYDENPTFEPPNALNPPVTGAIVLGACDGVIGAKADFSAPNAEGAPNVGVAAPEAVGVTGVLEPRLAKADTGGGVVLVL